MAVFYKGVLRSFLSDKFVPGTVTKDFNEALRWAERINGNKTKGPSRHIKHGNSCVIEMFIDEDTLSDHNEFQRPGVHEHARKNCWTSQNKTKAQINIVTKYNILTDEEIWDLITHKK